MYKIEPIKAFLDNYIWAINYDNNKAILIDPGCYKNSTQYLKKNNLVLDAIFLTHHHKDHSQGVAKLLENNKQTICYSLGHESYNFNYQKVNQGDLLKFDDFSFEVLEVKGHTLDSICFYNSKDLFCADTLFSAGCGRVFEGTYQQMHESLRKINSLDKMTNIYPGHEYTLSNLNFALSLTPTCQNTLKYKEIVVNKLEKNSPSLPTILALEQNINPFLRIFFQNYLEILSKNRIIQKNQTSLDAFRVLRNLKDKF